MSYSVLFLSIAILLTAYPVWYFVAHWNDQVFHEAAMAHWFGTVLGVIIGVPVAMYLAREQQRSQERAEKILREEDRQTRLKEIRGQLFEELTYNGAAVARLREVMSKSLHARLDMWQWAGRVADSLEFAAQRLLEWISLTTVERAIYAPVELAYRNLRRLSNGVREAAAAHQFFYGSSSDEASANWQLEELRQLAESVSTDLARACDLLAEKLAGSSPQQATASASV